MDIPEEPQLSPEEIVRRQAKKLGGGWRMEGPEGFEVMPVVILTTVEAQKVIDKLPLEPGPAPQPKVKGPAPVRMSEEELRTMAIKQPENRFWRTDLRIGRSIYVLLSNDPESPSDQDPMIGTMETTAIAEDVVNTHNAALSKYGRRYLDILRQEES